MSSAYNFTNTGYSTYTIEAFNLFHILDTNNNISELRAIGESYVAKLTSGTLAVTPTGLTKRANFNGCSPDQQSALNAAFPAATNYARESFAYLHSHNGPSLRYQTWFGAFTPARHNVVVDHFGRISQNNFAGFNYDCMCARENVYAYVYPDRFGTIFLCPAFWKAPATGTDSKAGTLVHEVCLSRLCLCCISVLFRLG